MPIAGEEMPARDFKLPNRLSGELSSHQAGSALLSLNTEVEDLSASTGHKEAVGRRDP